MASRLKTILILFLSPAIVCAATIQFTVDPTLNNSSITPLSYGTNQSVISQVPFHRSGGNRLTAYNWENNYSNAGSDYLYENDTYMGSPANGPAGAVTSFIGQCRADGAEPMVTLQMAGYVSADSAGPVAPAQYAPSSRFFPIVFTKGSAFNDPPNSADGFVYLDEFIHYLLIHEGSSSSGGVKYYCLDNEPGLWPSTHVEIHPAQPTYAEVASKGISVATMVTALDPNAQLFGPISYGWTEFVSNQNAPDAGTYSSYNTADGFGYLNYYLAQFSSASTTAGRRLLHFLDLHWYPEATGNNGSGQVRITVHDLSQGVAIARMQAPRSLWDPTYIENSWITSCCTNSSGITLIQRMQAAVSQYYPGTRLSISEHDYGANDDISGGIAEADYLGIVGKYGVASCWWQLDGTINYVQAAYQMYLNYDGSGSKFGDTAILGDSSSVTEATIYAAKDSAHPNRLNVILLNKDYSNNNQASVTLNDLTGGQQISSMRVFRFDSTTSTLYTPGTAPTFSTNHFQDNLPFRSATLYELTLSQGFSTSTPTPAPSATPSFTPTRSFTPTASPSFTSTASFTQTFSLTPTFTPSPFNSFTQTPTSTPTLSGVCVCDPDVTFTLKAEWNGPFAQTSQVDVDLGNSPETFVTAAYWQVYGTAPSPSVVTTQANNLRTLPYWRRVDVVNSFLTASGRTIPKLYSDPWTSQPLLSSAPCKSVTRDVGAVCMFFFSCPAGTNCGMDWANTHAEGMSIASSLYGFGAQPTNYYTSASSPGFWYRELMDARYAGLSYLLPNVYGPDLSDGSIANLATALNQVNSMGVTAPVKIGMFDDTWGWTNYSFAPWNSPPWASPPENLSAAGVTAAASAIYQNKWKPFFSQIPSQYWYEVGGHPLIYLYNAGTLPVDGSSQPAITTILQLLKNDFQADFGVTPYVVIDIGFSYGSAAVADNQFVWATLTSPYAVNHMSSYTNNGVTADLAMVKWDPKGRDDGGSYATATSTDGIIKDGSYLQTALTNSVSANFLTLATWNDLGEGTGINRNYDYYVQGTWEPPTYFMDIIRHAQQGGSCPTATSTATPSNTPTSLSTSSSTGTPDPTPTLSPSATASSTPSVSLTPSWAGTSTAALTASATASSTQTFTLTPSASFTGTSTSSSTNTPIPSTATYSSTPGATASWTPTASYTSTGTVTLTFTLSPVNSFTQTNTSTFTPTFSSTPTWTYSPVPPTATSSFTPVVTSTFTPSNSFTFTQTVSFTSTPTRTNTSVPPTVTSTFTPTVTRTFTLSNSLTFTPTSSLTPTVTPVSTIATKSSPLVYPNPVTGPGPIQLWVPLTTRSDVTLEVFTLSFRKVTEKTYPQVAVGTSLTLDLRDNRGNNLANGLYYVVALAQGNHWVTKLLVLN